MKSRSDRHRPAVAAFTDPEGRYTPTVPAGWEPRHGVVGEGIEVWIVAEADATVAATVALLHRLAGHAQHRPARRTPTLDEPLQSRPGPDRQSP